MMNSGGLCAAVRRAISAAADLVSPRYCELCRCRLAVGERLLCTTCNMLLARTDDWLSPLDNATVRLLWGRVAVERGAAFVRYVPHSKFAEAIYAMKYGDRPDIAEDLGRIVAAELSDYGFFEGIDTIVPMPLHPKRERKRGYNQSCEFARGLGRVAHIPVCGDAVRRVRNTVSQTTLTHDGRMSNVTDAFCVARPERLRGKHVLLVDDIITTGASMSALAVAVAKTEGTTLSFLAIGRTSH